MNTEIDQLRQEVEEARNATHWLCKRFRAHMLPADYDYIQQMDWLESKETPGVIVADCRLCPNCLSPTRQASGQLEWQIHSQQDELKQLRGAMRKLGEIIATAGSCAP